MRGAATINLWDGRPLKKLGFGGGCALSEGEIPPILVRNRDLSGGNRGGDWELILIVV